MRMQFLQHVPFEGPANLERWAVERGHACATAKLYAGDPLPAPEGYDWLVVMGGPMSVHDEALFPWLVAEKRAIAAAVDAGKRVLGVCLGAQLIAEVLGAAVTRNTHREIGWWPVMLRPEAHTSAIFGDFPGWFTAFHWHGETFAIPHGAMHIAGSDACAQQAFAYEDRVVGLQFHLESTADSIERLIVHGGDELTAGPYVQEVGALRRQPGHQATIGQLMTRMMDRLAAPVRCGSVA